MRTTDPRHSRGAAPSPLEAIAATLVNHIERRREEIATAEQMLEVLKTRHGIVPERHG
jgi:hypothetical protein